MKMSNILAHIKQTEADLLRSIETRNEIIKKEFKIKSWEAEKLKPAELNKKEKEFVKEKIKKIADMTKDINKLKSRLLQLKTEVNKKNVELGLDKMILELKWMRIELAALMKIVTKESYGFSNDIDHLKEIGLMDLIKSLEAKKIELDSELQNANFRTELS